MQNTTSNVWIFDKTLFLFMLFNVEVFQKKKCSDQQVWCKFHNLDTVFGKYLFTKYFQPKTW